MAKGKKKQEPWITKDIVITILIILGVILAGLYFYKWYQVKQEEKYISSYLIESNTISLEMTDINEINQVLSETPSYYFVYIGYTKDKDVYELEKDLKPIIDEYSLHNNFYYINVTNIKEENKNFMEDIASKLNINKDNISKVPIILYFKDGKLQHDGVYTAKEFKELLKKENVLEM